MVVATMLALVSLGQTQAKPIWQQIGVPYDNNNGYFEYLAAADILKAGNAGWYQAAAASPMWSKEILEASVRAPRELQKGDIPAPNLELLEMAKHVANMTPLQIRREAMSKFKDVFPLLEAARRKKTFDPRKATNFETLYPELAEFKELTRFLIFVAVETQFADGNVHGATQSILDGFRIGDATSSAPTLIGALVARALGAISLRSLEKHMVRLSLPDCEEVMKYAERYLAQEDMFARSASSEMADLEKVVDDVFANRKTGDSFMDAIADEVKDIPAARKAGYATQTKELLRKHTDVMAKLMAKDEKAWAEHLNGLPGSNSVREGDIEPDRNQPLPNRLAEMLTPVYDQVITTALLQRVQIRLLRAAMAIVRYRWTFDALPSSLKQAGTDEMMRDPVTGKPFTYRMKGQEFELIGTGSRGMGEIKLFYRRPESSGGAPPPSTE